MSQLWSPMGDFKSCIKKLSAAKSHNTVATGALDVGCKVQLMLGMLESPPKIILQFGEV